jgi:GAF domain-containing protein
MAANFVGTDDFVLLGQKVEELNCEIQRRREAQAALEQSEAELRLAVAALGGLNAISRRLADLRTERDLADAVVRELVAHTGALCAEAYVPADDGRTLHLVAAAGPAAEAIASVGRIPIADVAPAAEAFRSGTAIYLPATAMQERYGRVLAIGDAIAAVPILLQGRSAGVLTVAFAQSQEFGERERDFLEGVAQTFAGSLRRAQLFESELRSRRATERYADRIQRMLRITAALAQALSPEDVATAVIDDATKAMDASSGELWLVEEQGDSLELARSTGSGPGEKGAFARIALDGSRRLPVVTAVLEREAMFLERDDDLRRWPEIAVPPISVEQHGPLAVVPLIVQGRSVGAISWRYGRVRRIDDDERAMLMMIARYAAQALERARLYESERRARREAEQSEARALDADRRKDEFLAMLGHELRNPLAPILTALQLMRLRGGPAHERERAVIER